jgi:hypothetical protein
MGHIQGTIAFGVHSSHEHVLVDLKQRRSSTLLCRNGGSVSIQVKKLGHHSLLVFRAASFQFRLTNWGIIHY